MKHFLLSLTMAVMPMGVFAQFGVVAPLHVSGKQLVDQGGHAVVLHGVMDTPNPYFNRYRWGSACNDGTVASVYQLLRQGLRGSSKSGEGYVLQHFPTASRPLLDQQWPCKQRSRHLAVQCRSSAQVSADALLAYCSESFEPRTLRRRASAGGMPEGSEGGGRLSAIPQDGMEYRVKQCQLQE